MSLRIQSECGKVRSRKTPNKDTFILLRQMHLLGIIVKDSGDKFRTL